MESELFVWLVIIAFWLVSNLIRFLRRLAARGRQVVEEQKARQAPQRPGARRQAPPPPQKPAAPEPAAEDALAELLKSFGVEVETPSAHERPVASEHVFTPGEHSQAPSQTRGTASEHEHTPGWHQQAASELSETASEHTWRDSEHRGTASEHQAGDVFVPDLPDPPMPAFPATKRSVSPGLGRRVIAELHGDRESLARAFLLREVLGPPVGMRSSQDRSFES